MSSVDSGKENLKLTPVIPAISPRLIPGSLTNLNKGSLDWGWQSFVAYGCHNHVIIVDTQNVKVFQALVQHKSEVVKIKWAKEQHYHDLNNPYMLKLASADNTGNVIVWNARTGNSISSFSENSKPVQELQWISGRDACNHLMLALHPPYSVILWDTNQGTKVWKKSYTETLLSMAFDPFSDNSMAFLAPDCILFIDDFNITKTPSSNGRKFYITNPSSSAGQQLSNNHGHGCSPPEERSMSLPRRIIPKRMRFIIREDSKLSEDSVTLNECLQLIYHRSYKHHLLLLYQKEILILDLEINQTVGIVEHTGSPFVNLHSCWQRDAFFILHENGSVSFRLRHKGQRVMAAATPCGDAPYNFDEPNLEITYDLYCQSDVLRLTKHAKVIGMSICPMSENKVALLVSDGRMLFLELIIAPKNKQSVTCWSPHLSPLLPFDCNTSLDRDSKKFTKVPRITPVRHPATVLSDNIPPALYSKTETAQNIRNTFRFRISITGNLCALSAPRHVIRMCPPVTFRTWKTYKPYMAVGNAAGTIQVVNMATGIMTKEFNVHSYPIRGIEWINLTSFISFAHPNTANQLGHVRNEIVLTDNMSGAMKGLRVDHPEESPIIMIKVSHLRQYIIIAFKDMPFELWDLRLLVLLRVMPKNSPAITAVEWYHSHGHKKSHLMQDLPVDKLKDNLLNSEHCSETEKLAKSLIYVKERFVFTDANSHLHHFYVEGNTMKDATTMLPLAEAGMGCVTCIAWKGDYIVLGDIEGNLNVMNLKENESKIVATHRGWIRKILFGPGKGNMKIIILSNDGIDMQDLEDVSKVYSIRCPKDVPKIRDIDWVSSDKPCMIAVDGCLRIIDMKNKLYTSPVLDYESQEIPFCPHMFTTEIAFYLKSFLQHSLEKPEHFNSDIDRQDDHEMSIGSSIVNDLEMKNFLRKCPFGSAERALHIARLFGDEEGCHFWTVALYFLKDAKSKPLNQKKGSSDSNNRDIKIFFEQPLDTGYDVFCDNEMYKRLQLDCISVHVHKKTTYNQTMQCVERLLLLGETEKAVQLLLETEPGSDNFYVDCLRACLTATIQSSGTSQSIIKLVSTNLIASGRIMEGVQLLCLIHKGLDACQYLFRSGHWDIAVWLAKATLSPVECYEILKRWVDHLNSNNQKNKALLILLTMHQFWGVVKALHTSKMTERAAVFLQACMEFDVITRTDENSATIDAVFLEYSKHLLSIKNRTSAIHFCTLVSNIGSDLNKQIEFINEEL